MNDFANKLIIAYRNKVVTEIYNNEIVSDRPATSYRFVSNGFDEYDFIHDIHEKVFQWCKDNMETGSYIIKGDSGNSRVILVTKVTIFLDMLESAMAFKLRWE